MAIMAVDPFMYTPGPFGIGRIHNMAGSTELWVILGVVIEFVSTENGNPQKHEDHRHQDKRGSLE